VRFSAHISLPDRNLNHQNIGSLPPLKKLCEPVFFIALVVLEIRRIDYSLNTYPHLRVFYAQILDPRFFGDTV
jgi:hypothetical protein